MVMICGNDTRMIMARLGIKYRLLIWDMFYNDENKKGNMGCIYTKRYLKNTRQ